MSNLSKKYNIRIKDHNCDYLDYIDVQMRRKAGLGALNVAPSFGAFETKTVISNALSLSLFKNVNNFKSIVLDSKNGKNGTLIPQQMTLNFLVQVIIFLHMNPI